MILKKKNACMCRCKGGLHLCLWMLTSITACNWLAAVGVLLSADETFSLTVSVSERERGPAGPHHLSRSSRRLSELSLSSPSYFNQLREEATEWQGLQDANSTSYVFKVAVPNSTRVYRLAELKSFMPFTDRGKYPVTSTSEGFAALLAVYHFNNVEKSPILNETHVSNCKDLKLTMTLLDSMFDAIQTTRLFLEMMNTPKTFKNKPSAGIIGSYRSAVSLPLAILTGINHIPQVSPASSADDFDDKDLYPLFGRTYCNTNGEAQMAVEFFQSIGSTHVAILYLTVRETWKN
jgi:Receptor family ligand binding region